MNLFQKLAMMTALSTLAFTGVAATLPAAPAAAAAYLVQGMSGTEVSTLQSSLKTLGYYHYDAITGYFGSITTQAVKSFQAAYSLQADGIVGTATQTAISRALLKRNIVSDSWSYVGTPYLWGGKTPAGFDCSGFVYYLFTKHGAGFGYATSATLFTMGTPVAKSDLKPGDLVFYSLSQPGVVGHVGIYIGGGQFMSATSSKGIINYAMDNSYWAPKYLGAKRVY